MRSFHSTRYWPRAGADEGIVGNKRSEKREVARREAWGKQREGGFLGEKGVQKGMGMVGGQNEVDSGEEERARERDGVYVREILNGYGNGNGKGVH